VEQVRPAVVAGGALLLLVAIIGKFGGTALVARAGGMPRKSALGLGALMNARGVTDIVVLSTGLSIGVINGDAFTVLVMMALITTMMAGPALRLLGLSRRAEQPGVVRPGPGPGELTDINTTMAAEHVRLRRPAVLGPGRPPAGPWRTTGRTAIWSGDFAGGPVRTLAGRCTADGTLLFAYCMVLDDGAVVSGRCRSTPQLLDDGRIRLSEEWERYAPDAETGFSYLDELPPAAGRAATSPGRRAARG
jgi:hypothetical protein